MKLVILDRDGVINEQPDGFVTTVAEWKPLPGSLEAIARLTQAGYRVFVASNQSGIGRGIFDMDALLAINDRMQRACAEFGGRIDGFEFSPERPQEATDLRKPGPGMLRDIARRLQIGLDGVPMVGDRWSDIQAAHAAGAKPILVRTGHGARTEIERDLEGVEVFDSLEHFVGQLLAA